MRSLRKSNPGYPKNRIFILTLTLRSEDADPGLPLGDDIWTGPIYRVDAQGRATLLR